jgi:predicted aspartyl protease
MQSNINSKTLDPATASWERTKEVMLQGPFKKAESELAIQIQLQSIKMNNDFHHYVSQFTGIASKSGEMSQTTKCNYFLMGLPARFSGELYVDSQNKPWTQLPDLIAAATQKWTVKGKDLLLDPKSAENSGDGNNRYTAKRKFRGSSNKPNFTPLRRKGFHSHLKKSGSKHPRADGDATANSIAGPCWNCGEKGHRKADCPKNNGELLCGFAGVVGSTTDSVANCSEQEAEEMKLPAAALNSSSVGDLHAASGVANSDEMETGNPVCLVTLENSNSEPGSESEFEPVKKSDSTENASEKVACQVNDTQPSTSDSVCKFPYVSRQYLQALQQKLGLQVDLQAYVSIRRGYHTVPTVYTEKEFLDAQITGHTSLIHAPVPQLRKFIEHYKSQREQNSATGAVILVPMHYANDFTDLVGNMMLYQVVQPKDYGTFVSGITQKRIRAPSHYGVFVELPVSSSSIAMTSMLGEVPLFSFQASIVGAKSTVAVTSKTLVDSGATSEALISLKTVKKLGLSVHGDVHTVSLADGSLAQAKGTVHVKVKLQRHTFMVRALALDMVDDFDVILGEQWLLAHRAVIDYGAKHIILHRSKGVVVLKAPAVKRFHSATITGGVSVDTAQAADGVNESIDAAIKTAGTKPVKAMAVLRHVRQGGRIIWCAVRKVDAEHFIGDNDEDGEELSQRRSAILSEYEDVFVDILPSASKLKRREYVPETIPLQPGQKPVYVPGYRMSPREMQELQRQIKEGLESGAIRPSTSPFGAPVLFVVKKDGSLRMCVDYRRLNNVTVKNKYPLPRIDDLLDRLNGAQYFTALDLKSGYHQLVLPESDIPKTAFNTPFGHYEWTVLIEGLSNAVATFQSTMNHVLTPVLGKCALVYLDDVIIFSKSLTQHEKDVREVLDILRKEKLFANRKKCELFAEQLHYLGHIVSKQGIAVDASKTKVVQEWPEPQNVKELQSFLGLTNYFRKFVYRYSHIARPLTLLTGKGKWKPFGDAEKQAFQALKDALVSPPVLAIPDFNKPFHVYQDASDYALGGVLVQEGRPVAFTSRVLNSAERNYSTPERECLAIVHVYKEWRCYLEGVQSYCHTDHKPLTVLNTQPHLSRRQARWLEFLASFGPRVEYIPGRYNPADVLSRPPPSSLVSPPNGRAKGKPEVLRDGPSTAAPPSAGTPLWDEVTAGESVLSTRSGPNALVCVVGTRSGRVAGRPKEAKKDTTETVSSNNSDSNHDNESDSSPQAGDEVPTTKGAKDDGTQPWEVRGVLPGGAMGMTPAQVRALWVAAYRDDPFMTEHMIKKFQLVRSASGLWYEGKRLVVPELFHGAVLFQCHDAVTAGHPGEKRTQKVLEGSYWWHNWRADVKRYVAACHSCQRNKSATQKPAGLLSPLPIPAQPWESVSMDFITDLPLTAKQHNMLLVIVDRFSKMVHLVPCHNSLTAEDAAQLMRRELFRLHGTPSSFVVDRDKLWLSTFYTEWCRLLEIDITASSAFHPDTDGQTERMNRLLEEVLRHYVTPSHDNWDKLLDVAEYAINSGYNNSTKTTAFEIVYGYRPKSPFGRAMEAMTDTSKSQPALDNLRDRKAEFDRIRSLLQSAQDKQKEYADKRRRPVPDYKLGDTVWLSTKTVRLITTGTPKLLPRWVGPYKIIHLINGEVTKVLTAVKLELPPHWKIHNTFHVSRVKPYVQGTRVTPPPDTVDVEGWPEYEVEQVLSHRIVRGELQFWIKWKGYGEDWNSWEPEANLTCDGTMENSKLNEYWAAQSNTGAQQAQGVGEPDRVARSVTTGKLKRKHVVRTLTSRKKPKVTRRKSGTG